MKAYCIHSIENSELLSRCGVNLGENMNKKNICETAFEFITIFGIVSALAMMLHYADKLEAERGIKNNMLSSGTLISEDR